jgi:uncharacterized protein
VKGHLHLHSPVRIFAFSGLTTFLSLVAITVFLGPRALLVSLILIAVELAFSFDNAIINAKILERLSDFWQQIFLTVGVIIAIFGMRVVFPILIVMITADLGWGQVWNLALNQPAEYAKHLDEAHPSISAFGGSFLLMLALHFFMVDHREIHWIKAIERPMQKLAMWWVPAVLTILTLGLLAILPFNHHPKETMQAGIAGIVLYLGISIFTTWLGKFANKGKDPESSTARTAVKQTGFIAFLTFMYLQVLDASFSFDGVIGAFAITNDIIIIAAGLGIGAIWVRSMTVYMVRRGTLESYKYLEHGAHYAVFVLAGTMLLSLLIEIPEVVTGVLGLGLIAASIVASEQAIRANRRRSQRV